MCIDYILRDCRAAGFKPKDIGTVIDAYYNTIKELHDVYNYGTVESLASMAAKTQYRELLKNYERKND